MQSRTVRLCGVRVPGGVYATTPTSKDGIEVEKYLIDPPIWRVPTAEGFMPVVEAFGISPIGVTLWRDKEGTWHLLDWVGSKSYPNVADWIEEVRHLGVSRRVPVSLDYALLSPKSRIFLFHSRGHIHNTANWLLDEDPSWGSWHLHDKCPKELADHQPTVSLNMCARLYWQDVWGGDRQSDDKRYVVRELPCGEYNAMCPPDDTEAQYAPAMFASFPVVNLEIIRSDDGRDAQALEAASVAGIDAYTVAQ